MIYNVFLNSPVMWLLMLLSIITLAVILERIFFLSRININRIPQTNEIINILEPVATRSRIEQAKKLCNKQLKNNPLNYLLIQILDKIYLENSELKKTINLEIQKQIIPLQKRFTILNTSTAISPLLGLLGTVLGMIQSFLVISQGDQDGSSLANGISEALLTTAFGLAITIPGIIFYNYFVRKVNTIIDDMEIATTEIIDLLKKK